MQAPVNHLPHKSITLIAVGVSPVLTVNCVKGAACAAQKAAEL